MPRLGSLILAAWGAGLVLASSAAAFAAPDCKAILNAQAPGPTRVLSADVIEASPSNPWTPPGAASTVTPIVRPFCRVVASARPTPKSDIRFELWLPVDWNGDFFGTSSGGLAGVIDYTAMSKPLNRGFAAMGHNNGHFSGPTDLTWAFNKDGSIDRDRVGDFAWRSAHVATVAAKILVDDYYGRKLGHAFYVGCSQGGHHGQMEALRFPDDYDGIAAGGGGADWTSIMSSEAWAGYSVVKDNHAGGIPKAFLPVVYRMVMSQCDGLDGAMDGLIEDPRRCHVDFTPLQCRPGQTADCLTTAQIEATKAIYAGPPGGPGGHMPGSEAGWVNTWNAETEPGKRGAYFDFFRLLVRQQPDWKIEDFSWPADVTLSRERWDKVFGAYDPDLSKFKARGGKLILFHGWADPLMPPGQSMTYWSHLQSKMGAASVKTFARLFIVPGGGHCTGGPLDQAKTDWLGALKTWVENDRPPEPGSSNAILASGQTAQGVPRQRVLCPFPEVSRYDGHGDVNSAKSFVCAATGSR